MTTTAQIAKHLRDVHFGGNWTCVNLKDTLEGITWKHAVTQVHSFNTIVTLVYHIHYYVDAQLRVLDGGPLEAHDQYSFDHPPINSHGDWQALLDKVFADAERFAALVTQLPDSKLNEFVSEEKYGTWHRNLLGLIEHTHYHLGQISLIKKLLLTEPVTADVQQQ